MSSPRPSLAWRTPVATLGTATTPTNVRRLLRGRGVVFCFDGDAAGRKAAWQGTRGGTRTSRRQTALSPLFLPAGGAMTLIGLVRQNSARASSRQPAAPLRCIPAGARIAQRHRPAPKGRANLVLMRVRWYPDRRADAAPAGAQGARRTRRHDAVRDQAITTASKIAPSANLRKPAFRQDAAWRRGIHQRREAAACMKLLLQPCLGRSGAPDRSGADDQRGRRGTDRGGDVQQHRRTAMRGGVEARCSNSFATRRTNSKLAASPYRSWTTTPWMSRWTTVFRTPSTAAPNP